MAQPVDMLGPAGPGSLMITVAGPLQRSFAVEPADASRQ